ncbi:MAG: RsmB/NOP family class I SAM-dependent RNA methyltransferase, partial [Opitutaceae bacterium]
RRDGELPAAIRVDAEADLTATEAYRRGAIEIQDAGSQAVLEAVPPEPGGRWLDACAGAGGKSLQLAILLGTRGRVDVHDVRAAALAELEGRAARAGLSDRVRRTDRPEASAYDGVLVDAPCSGSGTWRRAPHLKWVTTPGRIAERARLQAELLARFSTRVRPGGRLLYATCSLAPRENEETARRFLEAHPGFGPEAPARSLGGRAACPGLLIPPAARDGDGFFVASFRRRR